MAFPPFLTLFPTLTLSLRPAIEEQPGHRPPNRPKFTDRARYEDQSIIGHVTLLVADQ